MRGVSSSLAHCPFYHDVVIWFSVTSTCYTLGSVGILNVIQAFLSFTTTFRIPGVHQAKAYGNERLTSFLQYVFTRRAIIKHLISSDLGGWVLITSRFTTTPLYVRFSSNGMDHLTLVSVFFSLWSGLFDMRWTAGTTTYLFLIHP